MAKKKTRRVKAVMVEGSGAFETVLASVLHLRGPIDGTLVIVPSLGCGKCNGNGVAFIAVVCPSCKTATVARAVCMKTFASLGSDGAIQFDGDLLNCDDCRARALDQPPAEPMRKPSGFDPRAN